MYVCVCLFVRRRLLDIAPHYYDMNDFPNCEGKRALESLLLQRRHKQRK